MGRELRVALGLASLAHQEASEGVVAARQVRSELDGPPIGRLGVVEASERFQGAAVVEQKVGGLRVQLHGRFELGQRAIVGARPRQRPAELRAGVGRRCILTSCGREDLERLVGAASLAVRVSQEEQQRDTLRAVLARGFELCGSVEEALLLDQRPAVACQQVRIVRKPGESLVHRLVAGSRLAYLPVELGQPGAVGGDFRLAGDGPAVRLDRSLVADRGVCVGQDAQGSRRVRFQGDRLFELPYGLFRAAGGLEGQSVDVARLGSLGRERGCQTTLIDGFPGLFLGKESQREVTVRPGVGWRGRDDLAERLLGALVVLLGEQALGPGEVLVGYGSCRDAHERHQNGKDCFWEH